MGRALVLARRGGRAVWPNPQVGCVLVKDGRTVAEGWHASYGGPHAEAEALRRAGKRARGCTAYVTLEPCGPHSGKKTPPCASALVKAGVSRVVAALKDPNPGVSGRGLAILRRGGVATALGPRQGKARSLNAEFFSRMSRARPKVILKTALSLDGQAHARGGASKWVTGPGARRLVHRLRADADAVLVGIGTVLKDDPALTSHGAGRNPIRVVLDARGRTPARARVLDGKAPTWIFTASKKTLLGAEMIRLKAPRGLIPPKEVLAVLARRGVKTVLVEGGPRVHASFLEAGVVDEARIFIAPKLLSGSSDPNLGPRVLSPRLKRVGPDFLFYGRVKCSRG
jgi:diaminohydroxyphosphoribosylaminopyrimidine deaminase/5-amino-6-(5-phosphoribosylamino)uracil reductase